MPKLFKPDDKVTFDLDPTGEIFTVIESRLHYTSVVSYDGVDISFCTDDLRIAEIPVAV